MNLQNLSKGLNFPIALTFLFALILTILVNTLDLVEINNKVMTLNDLSNNIQPVIYSILAVSLVCLILNLTTFKKKVLSSVIFLVLLVGLFIASIILIINVSNLQVQSSSSTPTSSPPPTNLEVHILFSEANNIASYNAYTHLKYLALPENNSSAASISYINSKLKAINEKIIWPNESSKTNPYVPAVASVLPKIKNTGNADIIKIMSYLLGVFGIIASVTNKGFTIYKLIK